MAAAGRWGSPGGHKENKEERPRSPWGCSGSGVGLAGVRRSQRGFRGSGLWRDPSSSGAVEALPGESAQGHCTIKSTFPSVHTCGFLRFCSLTLWVILGSAGETFSPPRTPPRHGDNALKVLQPFQPFPVFLESLRAPTLQPGSGDSSCPTVTLWHRHGVQHVASQRASSSTQGPPLSQKLCRSWSRGSPTMQGTRKQLRVGTGRAPCSLWFVQ